jgi:hypothetical protein
MARSRDWLAHIGIQKKGCNVSDDKQPETPRADDTRGAKIDPGVTTSTVDVAKNPPPPVARPLAPSATPEKPQRRSDLQDFLKASGYRESDVLDYSSASRAFVTKNGGKYAFNRRNQLRIISGPDFPKLHKGDEE